ncbi:MAG TPA: hypothetical protein P5121_06050 [Caldilineaceae bacterium]|nr:hypothetical protein [Caldilineaceae bacterium]
MDSPSTVRWQYVLPFVGLSLLTLLFVVLLWNTDQETEALPWVEPLVPTSIAGAPPTATPRDRKKALLLSAAYPLVPQSTPEPYTLRWRIGVGIPEFNPLLFPWPENRPGWYLNWTADLNHDAIRKQKVAALYLEPPPASGLGMSFAPMIRVDEGKIVVPLATVAQLAADHPGRLWLIGNEPDVRWQDNTAPDPYAVAYHELYTVIKAVDPTAQVAIGAISQVTPLRLRYLELVLDSYEAHFGVPMPVDVWNIHVFVLREEAGNWGVDIPPGLEDVEAGILWEVADHNNLQLVENQVRLMRRWLAARGERQKPLIISEYGILMPAEYGFPPEKVAAFMRGSFDLFLSLRDEKLGYSADDNRLIQRWVWFSSRFHLYPTGDLFAADDSATVLMAELATYLAAADSVK